MPIAEDEQPVSCGVHAKLLLRDGVQRTYSIVSGNSHRFELCVALADPSRGGSQWLNSVTPIGRGAVVQVRGVTPDVPSACAASNYVFAAGGGIGIMAFLALMEVFSADATGNPFEAEVANRDGKVVKVDEEETLLEVLKREFGSDQVESSCEEVGNCGTCKNGLKDGRVDHRGTALRLRRREVAC